MGKMSSMNIDIENFKKQMREQWNIELDVKESRLVDTTEPDFKKPHINFKQMGFEISTNPGFTPTQKKYLQAAVVHFELSWGTEQTENNPDLVGLDYFERMQVKGAVSVALDIAKELRYREPDVFRRLNFHLGKAYKTLTKNED